MQSISVTVLIAAAGCAAFLAAAQNPPPGAVEGTVVNSATGAGIGGASVVLSARPSKRYEATSDAAGHFKITGVAPGSYFAGVSKDGFETPLLDPSSLLNSELRVASDSDPVKVELKLTPFDIVMGRVLGPSGEPAAGVEVSLYPNIMATVAVTDKEGRFRLENIRPGSYTLIARPPASAQPEEAKDGTRTAIVATYYPSFADQSLAQQIVLRGQGDLSGYEIRMQTAVVHRMRGIVLDQEGKPSQGAQLRLFPIRQGTPGPMGLSLTAGELSLFALGMRPAPSGAPEATAAAGENGHFEFPAVRSGDWRIIAVSGPGRDRQGVSSRGAAGALVGRGDVDDLQIHVATPFKLTATVEWKGEDPGRISDPRVLSNAVILMDPEGGEFVRFGAVESGRLLFDDTSPGRYRLIVKPGLAAQVFLGGNEVTGTFPVAANGPPLRVVLKPWSGTVRGTVEKCDGVTVVLVPQRVEGMAFGQTVVCGTGGLFELREVSPGDDYIVAFDHMNGFTPSAAMLSLLPSRGTSVKVEEGSAANVTLSVIAGPR